MRSALFALFLRDLIEIFVRIARFDFNCALSVSISAVVEHFFPPIPSCVSDWPVCKMHAMHDMLAIEIYIYIRKHFFVRSVDGIAPVFSNRNGSVADLALVFFCHIFSPAL